MHRNLSIAFLSVQLTAGRELQLLPAGEFRARDGRPGKLGSWRIDAAIAAKLIALAAARQTPFVIDYEHQTLLAEKNGQPAPAAGWFKALEWRDGKGLYATDVEWTAKASAMIDAREYRFISPVFGYDSKTGAVIQLHHAALVNNPALDGMQELAGLAAAKFSATQTEQECDPMSEQLKKLLGLAADADDKSVEGAIAALTAKAGQVDSLTTEVAALKSASADPAKYVPIATMQSLQTQVADLSAKLNDKEVGDLVSAALTAGKLLPAQETWARELGKKDVAALKVYIETAQPVAALGGTQTGGKAPAGGDKDGLNDADLAVCKQMGLDPEEFKKTKTAQAAA